VTVVEAVSEREAAMVKVTAMEGAEPAAVKAATSAAVETTAAMPAAHLGHESIGTVFRRGHCARIDRRQRLGTLAGCG
jgi:hypothetical protein